MFGQRYKDVKLRYTAYARVIPDLPEEQLKQFLKQNGYVGDITADSNGRNSLKYRGSVTASGRYEYWSKTVNIPINGDMAQGCDETQVTSRNMNPNLNRNKDRNRVVGYVHPEHRNTTGIGECNRNWVIKYFIHIIHLQICPNLVQTIHFLSQTWFTLLTRQLRCAKTGMKL